MSSKRLHMVLLGVISLMFVSLVVGAYGINSLMSKEAAKLTELKAKSQALDQEQIGLIKAKKDVQNYADLEKITRAIVPEDKSQAEAVRQIVNIAADNGISLASVTFPASTLGSNVKPGATAAPTPAPAANPNAKSLSQLQPVKGISGVYQLTIVVNSDPNNPVPYNRFIGFLQDLENNRRTAQVSGITLQPDVKNRNLLSFNLTLNNYIKP
jgi:DNA uptake protein ComE-like DNA-binding protein